MEKSTIDNLKRIAPDLLEGKVNSPASIAEQRAIAILEILRDHQWHTAAEIAQILGIGAKYARDILRACQEGWGLESRAGRGDEVGWRLPKIYPNRV